MTADLPERATKILDEQDQVERIGGRCLELGEVLVEAPRLRGFGVHEECADTDDVGRLVDSKQGVAKERRGP